MGKRGDILAIIFWLSIGITSFYIASITQVCLIFNMVTMLIIYVLPMEKYGSNPLAAAFLTMKGHEGLRNSRGNHGYPL